MFGDNPIRSPKKGDGDSLYVQDIFTTFQGEGPYTGWPAVFIRLGGCNLSCDFCDTDFESFEELSLEEILKKIDDLSSKKKNLIVITGGEPMRQPIEKLCDALLKRDYMVQIETNGTLFRDINQNVEIVCSPKNTGKGGFKIRKDLLKKITAFKFVISANNNLYKDIANVKDSGIPIYLQPMDEYDEKKNKKNLEAVVKLASENGYRISLQIHKIIGIK